MRISNMTFLRFLIKKIPYGFIHIYSWKYHLSSITNVTDYRYLLLLPFELDMQNRNVKLDRYEMRRL